MKKVLVVLPIEERHHAVIEEGMEGCEFTYADQRNVSEEHLKNADIILGNVLPPQKLMQAEKLEFLALESAGADAFVKPGVLPHELVMTNATGVYSKPVAEHGLAMTLALMKNLPMYRDLQSRCIWKGADQGLIPVSSPVGCTVLVVGLGDIGLYYARLMKALGAYIIGVKRRESECPECVDELYTTDRIDEVIGRADVIFSVLPGTKATYHFYDGARFAKMKPSAFFLNCGRGASVDTEALCSALENGVIAAAACDVFETEPLPADHRAWKIPNLLITPHRAGFYDLPGTLDHLAALSARNLKAWLTGGDLTNVVDFSTGYKK